MNAKVSICIPVFNRANLIGRAIQSALNQSEFNIEVVVVDNSSDDGTYEIVQRIQLEDSRVRLYKNEQNIGAVANFKRSIEKSSAPYVVLLGSDDFLERDFVKNKLKVVSKYPLISMVSGPVKLHRNVDGIEKVIAHYEYESELMSAKNVNNSFYKKYLISYFCMFRRDQILKFFTDNFSDPFNWGVYKKGFGLDIINCLKILNEGQYDHALYYQKGGAYCFTNPPGRESEEIMGDGLENIKRTYNDYCYSTFLFREYLNTVDKKSADCFIEFKLKEFMYEMLREVLIGHAKVSDACNYIKDFSTLHNLNISVFLIAIIKLPHYVFIRNLQHLKRKIKYE